MERTGASQLVVATRAGALGVALVWILASCNSSGPGSAPTTATTVAASRFTTLINAGILLLRHDNASAATQLFQQAIQADPRNPIGYYNLGVVDQTERDVGAALREYRLAVEADPRYVPALYNEAVALSGTDRAQAISLYQEVISLQPDSPTALLNLGLLDFGTGRRSQGKVLLRRAVKLEPSLESKIPASIHAEVAAP